MANNADGGAGQRCGSFVGDAVVSWRKKNKEETKEIIPYIIIDNDLLCGGDQSHKGECPICRLSLPLDKTQLTRQVLVTFPVHLSGSHVLQEGWSGK